MKITSTDERAVENDFVNRINFKLDTNWGNTDWFSDEALNINKSKRTFCTSFYVKVAGGM